MGANWYTPGVWYGICFPVKLIGKVRRAIADKKIELTDGVKLYLMEKATHDRTYDEECSEQLTRCVGFLGSVLKEKASVADLNKVDKSFKNFMTKNKKGLNVCKKRKPEILAGDPADLDYILDECPWMVGDDGEDDDGSAGGGE